MSTMSDAEKRHLRALERLGTSHPVCVACGEDDPRCLEAHHIAGRAFDDQTVLVCRNCHRKLSDAQKDHPGKIGDPPSPLERIAHFLLGIGDMLHLIADSVKQFAADLLGIVAGMKADDASS